MKRRLAGWAFILLLMTAGQAHAIAVDAATLQDPVMEERARALMHGLRCLVCQNQSIEISDAELAGDLRRIVRERVAAGDTDDQVRAHLVARYGDWVLMRPPVKLSTLALWAGPPVLLILGGLTLWMAQRRRIITPPAPLSEAEKVQLQELARPD
jgi:cytochrome c-type biogenesis protein CcmH